MYGLVRAIVFRGGAGTNTAHALAETSSFETTNHSVSVSVDVIVLINVFTVDPTNQQRLVEILTKATDVSVRRAKGLISATLHRSIDGTKVTMYAQWQSVTDYQAMRENPAPRPFFEEALSIAEFEPGMYEVIRTFTPADT